MHNRGVAVRVACRLHNVCIKDVGAKAPRPVSRGSVPGFEHESDGQPGDNQAGFCSFTDGTAVGRGFRSNREACPHRDRWTDSIKDAGLTRPVYSKFSKATVRN